MVVIHPWLGFGARTLGSLGECVCSRRCVLFCPRSPFALPRFPRAVHSAFLARSLLVVLWSAVRSPGESVMDRARGGLLDTTVRLLTRRNSVYVAFILTGALVGERVCSLSLSLPLSRLSFFFLVLEWERSVGFRQQRIGFPGPRPQECCNCGHQPHS